jgi:hypothetical protein
LGLIFGEWAQAEVLFVPILPKISPILGGSADELSQVLEAPAVAVPVGAACGSVDFRRFTINVFQRRYGPRGNCPNSFLDSKPTIAWGNRGPLWGRNEPVAAAILPFDRLRDKATEQLPNSLRLGWRVDGGSIL